MTHSLHRQGTRENLSNDFVIYFAPAPGINSEGSGPKHRRFLEIAFRNNVKNAGYAGFGNLIEHSQQELLDKGSGGAAQICCDSKEDVVKILKETIEADMGLSIVVQGVVEEIEDCLDQLGLKMHTVHHSLGVWGKTEKLPGKNVLEITTMCGHGLVSTNLVHKLIDDVISGSISSGEAARLMTRQCRCGIFNISRAEALLDRLASRAKNNSKDLRAGD